jgi:hypothetical protein
MRIEKMTIENVTAKLVAAEDTFIRNPYPGQPRTMLEKAGSFLRDCFSGPSRGWFAPHGRRSNHGAESSP